MKLSHPQIYKFCVYCVSSYGIIFRNKQKYSFLSRVRLFSLSLARQTQSGLRVKSEIQLDILGPKYVWCHIPSSSIYKILSV